MSISGKVMFLDNDFLVCKTGVGRVVCTSLERILHIVWHTINVPEMTVPATIIIIIIFISII